MHITISIDRFIAEFSSLIVNSRGGMEALSEVSRVRCQPGRPWGPRCGTKKPRSQSTLGRPPPKLACSNARNQKRVYRGTYVPVDKKFYPHLQSVVDRFMCYAKSKSSGAVVGKVYERGFFVLQRGAVSSDTSGVNSKGPPFFPPRRDLQDQDEERWLAWRRRLSLTGPRHRQTGRWSSCLAGKKEGQW